MAKADKDFARSFPMPKENTTLDFKAVYSPKEFAKISRGVIPQSTDDRWFIYLDENTLYFHRSWTGYCIYTVDFVIESGKHVVSRVLVSRDPEQYRCISDEEDVETLKLLINLYFLKRVPSRPCLTNICCIRWLKQINLGVFGRQDRCQKKPAL